MIKARALNSDLVTPDDILLYKNISAARKSLQRRRIDFHIKKMEDMLQGSWVNIDTGDIEERTRMVDKWLLGAIEGSNGTVVEIGAGCSTRPTRLSRLGRKWEFYDLPHNKEFYEKSLGKERIDELGIVYYDTKFEDLDLDEFSEKKLGAVVFEGVAALLNFEKFQQFLVRFTNIPILFTILEDHRKVGGRWVKSDWNKSPVAGYSEISRVGVSEKTDKCQEYIFTNITNAG